MYPPAAADYQAWLAVHPDQKVLVAQFDDYLKIKGVAGVVSANATDHPQRYGAAYHNGLGFYDGVRFHIDSKGFRTWDADHRGASSPCD